MEQLQPVLHFSSFPPLTMQLGQHAAITETGTESTSDANNDTGNDTGIGTGGVFEGYFGAEYIWLCFWE